jgi:uncharacterized protein (DUF486 family)
MTIGLLIVSNFFMTLAWYGHLQFKEKGWLKTENLAILILISWGLALFEYIFQVPANRIGHKEHGGPFSLFELKTIQEVVSLVVFTLVVVFIFKTEKPAWNHLVGFGFIVLAVFFVFKKF